ncbi:hypothetical protein F511_26221 [Dorcoceras hygrometricum]|uniref:Uncharacterized protein n=1 Tax=Dorcoceras hygrometricum TaxID=472368 RepID=A0A2Z7B822_9LAMI|nr:hypothetical protein F511_26221 [Dorcoceras hygrometricum]
MLANSQFWSLVFDFEDKILFLVEEECEAKAYFLRFPVIDDVAWSKVSDLSVRDSCCGNCSTEAKDASIEDERKYRAPHISIDLVVSRYETSG